MLTALYIDIFTPLTNSNIEHIEQDLQPIMCEYTFRT